MRGEEHFDFFILVSLLLNCTCLGEASGGADACPRSAEEQRSATRAWRLPKPPPDSCALSVPARRTREVGTSFDGLAGGIRRAGTCLGRGEATQRAWAVSGARICRLPVQTRLALTPVHSSPVPV